MAKGKLIAIGAVNSCIAVRNVTGEVIITAMYVNCVMEPAIFVLPMINFGIDNLYQVITVERSNWVRLLIGLGGGSCNAI